MCHFGLFLSLCLQLTFYFPAAPKVLSIPCRDLKFSDIIFFISRNSICFFFKKTLQFLSCHILCLILEHITRMSPSLLMASFLSFLDMVLLTIYFPTYLACLFSFDWTPDILNIMLLNPGFCASLLESIRFCFGRQFGYLLSSLTLSGLVFKLLKGLN